MSTAPSTIPLTTDELRAVTAYALACAQSLVIFTRTCPDDGRPQAALDAAARFAEGARRTNLQRTAAVDVRRAAAEAPTDAARHAAIAAADASAAAGCNVTLTTWTGTTSRRPSGMWAAAWRRTASAVEARADDVDQIRP